MINAEESAARFRAKRKAHINNVERQITHLESQSTTLTKQVEDLRKENGFLKVSLASTYRRPIAPADNTGHGSAQVWPRR
jgi:chaperonin cofactor prefoldin